MGIEDTFMLENIQLQTSNADLLSHTTCDSFEEVSNNI